MKPLMNKNIQMNYKYKCYGDFFPILAIFLIPFYFMSFCYYENLKIIRDD